MNFRSIIIITIISSLIINCSNKTQFNNVDTKSFSDDFLFTYITEENPKDLVYYTYANKGAIIYTAYLLLKKQNQDSLIDGAEMLALIKQMQKIGDTENYARIRILFQDSDCGGYKFSRMKINNDNFDLITIDYQYLDLKKSTTNIKVDKKLKIITMSDDNDNYDFVSNKDYRNMIYLSLLFNDLWSTVVTENGTSDNSDLKKLLGVSVNEYSNSLNDLVQVCKNQQDIYKVLLKKVKEMFSINDFDCYILTNCLINSIIYDNI